MAKYKAKTTCVGAVPFWVNDHIGIENYNKLNVGESIELSDTPQPQVLEWLDSVAEESKKSDEGE